MNIENEVPIPIKRSAQVPLRELEVGQSVVFPLEHRPNIQSMASRTKRETGKAFTIKKLSEIEARIWRIK